MLSTTLGEMTDADEEMNPLHLETNIWIQINLEIRI